MSKLRNTIDTLRETVKRDLSALPPVDYRPVFEFDPALVRVDARRHSGRRITIGIAAALFVAVGAFLFSYFAKQAADSTLSGEIGYFLDGVLDDPFSIPEYAIFVERTSSGSANTRTDNAY